MFSELTTADRWLYSVLSMDDTIQTYVGNPARIYAEDVPSEVEFPYILFRLQDSLEDSYAVGNIRVLATADYVVEAIGQAQSPDFVALEPLVSQIDLLLQGGAGSNAAGVVAQCVRVRPWRYREVDDEGRHYAHLGGVYRLVLQAE